MDPVFYAGLNLGSAEIYRQIVKDESGFKDGSPFVNTAASLLSRARDTNFSGIVKHLQEIGRDWKGRFPELPNVLEAIQQVEGVAGAVYQKVSCGFMLGQAMETCRQAKKRRWLRKPRPMLSHGSIGRVTMPLRLVHRGSIRNCLITA